MSNRRAFSEALEAEIKRSVRHKKSFSIAFLDLDNLKTTNDQSGHKIGDKLIISTANLISKKIRGTDLAARLGGDEFIILMPETDSDGAKIVVKRVQDALKSPTL